MSVRQLTIPNQTVVKIIEVNPQRETLTVFNYNSLLMALAPHDAPFSSYALNRIEALPLWPHMFITLEARDGDHPDRAYWVYNPGAEAYIIVSETMKPTEKRRWW